MAGALTPTEVFQAHRLGCDMVKVFPGSLTGPSYIKALHGPFPEIPLMPTGGVSLGNIGEWFAAGVVAVGAGSEMCPPESARQGQFDEIHAGRGRLWRRWRRRAARGEARWRRQRQARPSGADLLLHRRDHRQILDHEGLPAVDGGTGPRGDRARRDRPADPRQPGGLPGGQAQIKYDPLSLGALVTTHKMDLYEAARDMFDYLDPYATICGEMSSISKRDGRLEGHAKDPITAGLSLDAISGAGYFGRSGGEVLCFGAGGSAVATLLHLINKPDPADRPRRFVVVNRSPGRLEHLREMVAAQAPISRWNPSATRTRRSTTASWRGCPEHSVVINATGMGKDTPGSPITEAGLFPRHGIAWEFNYRGELDFLHQALAQVETRGSARRGRLAVFRARLDAGGRAGAARRADPGGVCAAGTGGRHRPQVHGLASSFSGSAELARLRVFEGDYWVI